MGKTIRLEFRDKPVDAETGYEGSNWGDPRPYGGHIGIDYNATWRSHVKAVEDGVVVKSENKEGSANKVSYGNTVVIDHTPEGGDKQRHIYTLYAHLYQGLVSVGKKVEKGKTIGESGNTGTRENPKGLAKKDEVIYQGGHQLHFEVIDSPVALDWSKGKWPSGHRKKPGDYLGQTETIEYAFTEEEMNKIQAHVDPRPRIDWKRGRCHVDWYVGGKYKGRTDKHRKEIDLKLTSAEVEEILAKPLPPSGKESKVYEVKIG